MTRTELHVEQLAIRHAHHRTKIAKVSILVHCIVGRKHACPQLRGLNKVHVRVAERKEAHANFELIYLWDNVFWQIPRKLSLSAQEAVPNTSVGLSAAWRKNHGNEVQQQADGEQHSTEPPSHPPKPLSVPVPDYAEQNAAENHDTQSNASSF